MAMNIDLTQILIALISGLFAVISAILVPKIKQMIESKVNEKEIDIIIKFSEIAVKFVEEKLWEKPGHEKRKLAIEFLQEMLNKYNIDTDIDTLNKYLDFSVQNYIRNKD